MVGGPPGVRLASSIYPEASEASHLQCSPYEQCHLGQAWYSVRFQG